MYSQNSLNNVIHRTRLLLINVQLSLVAPSVQAKTFFDFLQGALRQRTGARWAPRSRWVEASEERARSTRRERGVPWSRSAAALGPPCRSMRAQLISPLISGREARPPIARRHVLLPAVVARQPDRNLQKACIRGDYF